MKQNETNEREGIETSYDREQRTMHVDQRRGREGSSRSTAETPQNEGATIATRSTMVPPESSSVQRSAIMEGKEWEKEEVKWSRPEVESVAEDDSERYVTKSKPFNSKNDAAVNDMDESFVTGAVAKSDNGIGGGLVVLHSHPMKEVDDTIIWNQENAHSNEPEQGDEEPDLKSWKQEVRKRFSVLHPISTLSRFLFMKNKVRIRGGCLVPVKVIHYSNTHIMWYRPSLTELLGIYSTIQKSWCKLKHMELEGRGRQRGSIRVSSIIMARELEDLGSWLSLDNVLLLDFKSEPLKTTRFGDFCYRNSLGFISDLSLPIGIPFYLMSGRWIQVCVKRVPVGNLVDGVDMLQKYITDPMCRISSIKPIVVAVSEGAQFVVKGLNLSRSTARVLCTLEEKFLSQENCADIRGESNLLMEHHEIQSLSFSCFVPSIVRGGFITVEDHGLSSSFFSFIVAEKDVCSEICTLESLINIADTANFDNKAHNSKGPPYTGFEEGDFNYRLEGRLYDDATWGANPYSKVSFHSNLEDKVFSNGDGIVMKQNETNEREGIETSYDRERRAMHVDQRRGREGSSRS